MKGPRPKPFECPEPVFWYLVGLIASDGNLGRNTCNVNITSKHQEFLEQIRVAIGSRGSISHKSNGTGQIAYQLQFKSRILRDRLSEIGLTPNKSLTIGPLHVPDEWFHDFLRGVIDGDGNIRRWVHPTNRREQWVVRICGASRPFIAWLQETIKYLWGIEGKIHEHIYKDGRRHPIYTLKLGKLAAKVLLSRCYYSGALALERKRDSAIECITTFVG